MRQKVHKCPYGCISVRSFTTKNRNLLANHLVQLLLYSDARHPDASDSDSSPSPPAKPLRKEGLRRAFRLPCELRTRPSARKPFYERPGLRWMGMLVQRLPPFFAHLVDYHLTAVVESVRATVMCLFRHTLDRAGIE